MHKGLRARQRAARHVSFAGSLPSVVSAWAAPPMPSGPMEAAAGPGDRPAAGGSCCWEEGRCPRNSLMLELSVLLSSHLVQPCREHAGTPGGWHELNGGTGNNLLGYRLPYWGQHCIERALFGLHTRFSSTRCLPEELRAGQPGLASSSQSVLQSPRSLLHTELKAASDKAAERSCENWVFSCRFRVPHSTAKKEWMQVLRGSPSSHYNCCLEGFKLQRELVEVVRFCRMMAGRGDCLVIHHFLCGDTTTCLCHAVARFPHIFKRGDFLCVCWEKNMKICP